MWKSPACEANEVKSEGKEINTARDWHPMTYFPHPRRPPPVIHPLEEHVLHVDSASFQGQCSAPENCRTWSGQRSAGSVCSEIGVCDHDGRVQCVNCTTEQASFIACKLAAEHAECGCREINRAALSVQHRVCDESAGMQLDC